MDRSERKAAVSAYKERKAVAGVYAIRCAATDAPWVGAAPDLSTIWTRRTFALRQGIETNRALQSAWNAQNQLPRSAVRRPLTPRRSLPVD